MSYVVVNKFQEKHDKMRIYKVGDPYPLHEGYKPTKKRLEYLSKPNPAFDNKVFLEEVKEVAAKKEKAATKDAKKEKKESKKG